MNIKFNITSTIRNILHTLLLADSADTIHTFPSVLSRNKNVP